VSLPIISSPTRVMANKASALPDVANNGDVIAGEHHLWINDSFYISDAAGNPIEGTSAQWASPDADVAYFMGKDSKFYLWRRHMNQVVVVREQGFNHFSAPFENHWAGSNDLGPGPQTVFSNNQILKGVTEPELSRDPGVWAALLHENKQIISSHGTPSRYAASSCMELKFAGRALAWRVSHEGRWQIAGVRDLWNTREEPQLLNIEPEEFWPQPIWIDGELWLMTHSHDRLLLRPWGEKQGYVVATGQTHHNNLGTETINVSLRPRVDLRLVVPPPPPPPPPPEEEEVNTPGIDVIDYAKVIEPGKDLLIVHWKDRNNTGHERKVWIKNGRLRVEDTVDGWKTKFDRTGDSRVVTVKC
jgi:hypothetical protein